jgi:hydrogenase nickel incorporation protein HypA/HybF
MHELAIAESIVDAVCERAAGRTIHRVTIRIGELTALVPAALRFSFDLAVEGTVADGATLDITVTPGRELQIVSMEVD